MNNYVIGMDFGTLSARATLINVHDGSIENESVYEYPHGVICEYLEDGTPLPENYALADSKDYRSALFGLIKQITKPVENKSAIIGIGIAATSYTMVPCFSDGSVLSEYSQYKHRPMAYIKLWKHHGAESQARRIMELHHITGKLPVLERYGKSCNCEWCLPKLLETFEVDRDVFNSVDRFCDLGEWLCWLLTGCPVNSIYSYAFKAAWAEDIGCPDPAFLELLGDGFSEGYTKKISGRPSYYDSPCGFLSEEAAVKLDLPAGIPVATPIGDGSAPFIFYNYINPDAITITLGTSIAMAFLRNDRKAIFGINGVANDGFLDSKYYLYDAGQPCAGDMLDWFIRNQVPESYYKKADVRRKNIHSYLSDLSEMNYPQHSQLTVLDWFNGNRSILNNASLRGCIIGLSLDTKPEDIYCAMIQGMACGTKKILEYFTQNGIEFNKVILCGGIAEKNSFIRSEYANILGREIHFSAQNKITAKSAGILAAIAGGVQKNEAIKLLANQNFITVNSKKESEKEYQSIYKRWEYYHNLLSKPY